MEQPEQAKAFYFTHPEQEIEPHVTVGEEPDPAPDRDQEGELVVGVTPAVNVIGSLRGGALFELFGLELQRAVLALNAAEDGNPKAEVTLKIKMARQKNVQGALLVTAKIASKLPEQPVPSDILFGDEEGRITTHNPRQREMFRRPRSA